MRTHYHWRWICLFTSFFLFPIIICNSNWTCEIFFLLCLRTCMYFLICKYILKTRHKGYVNLTIYTLMCTRKSIHIKKVVERGIGEDNLLANSSCWFLEWTSLWNSLSLWISQLSYIVLSYIAILCCWKEGKDLCYEMEWLVIYYSLVTWLAFFAQTRTLLTANVPHGFKIHTVVHTKANDPSLLDLDMVNRNMDNEPFNCSSSTIQAERKKCLWR